MNKITHILRIAKNVIDIKFSLTTHQAFATIGNGGCGGLADHNPNGGSMKPDNRVNRTTIRALANALQSALVLLALSTTVQAQVPVGELDVRGSAQLGQPEGIGMVTVRDTTYTWFSGDRIEVQSGAAILTLDDGHSFGFPEGTKATLGLEEDRIRVDLDAGMLLYAIEGEEVELQVQNGDFLHFARPAGALEPCLGLNATGLIHANADIENKVIVQTGELDGGTSDRAIHYTVEPGEQVIFNTTGFVVTDIELPEEVERELEDLEDGSALPCIIWWLREEGARGLIGGLTPATSFWLGTAAGFATYQILFDEDEDECPICPDPPSP